MIFISFQFTDEMNDTVIHKVITVVIIYICIQIESQINCFIACVCSSHSLLPLRLLRLDRVYSKILELVEYTLSELLTIVCRIILIQ